MKPQLSFYYKVCITHDMQLSTKLLDIPVAGLGDKVYLINYHYSCKFSYDEHMDMQKDRQNIIICEAHVDSPQLYYKCLLSNAKNNKMSTYCILKKRWECQTHPESKKLNSHTLSLDAS